MSRPFWVSPKIAGVSMLCLAFMVGVLAGAVAMDMGAHTRLHPRPFWADRVRPESLKTFQRELDLTPDQTREMATILDDFGKYYQTVLSDGKARIDHILNDEQKVKFRRWLQDQKP